MHVNNFSVEPHNAGLIVISILIKIFITYLLGRLFAPFQSINGKSGIRKPTIVTFGKLFSPGQNFIPIKNCSDELNSN